MSFIKPTKPFELKGKTIVIPVVSTGNIGQLAVDLIISSLSLERIAILDPQYCIPVVGAREDGLEGMTTPLELYGNPKLEFVVIQQRSPVLKALKQQFIDALFAFIKSSEFSSVLFLSGVDLSNRTDSQMLTPTYQIRPKNSASVEGSPLASLLDLPIPIYTSPTQPLSGQPTDDSEIPFIPGGGLTRRILSSIPSGWPIPTASVLQFVIEGDNRPDAGYLASVATRILNSDITQWREPTSWRGLFGTPHDQTLYG
ncbi:hypothetical protein D9619_001700 [Psilocybe cf. subviscida]|uniref:Proteasome assembly chaperone 2 n=1 Tax=Psilocybe cf. subviscida TaxID=2480587 RepID=A0A8H5F3R4_9AGAR|nr:hypothetical protein D9619_001700 [Psilocybe cf. subviscida]